MLQRPAQYSNIKMLTSLGSDVLDGLSNVKNIAAFAVSMSMSMDPAASSKHVSRCGKAEIIAAVAIQHSVGKFSNIIFKHLMFENLPTRVMFENVSVMLSSYIV